jgi:hypothetical protein
VRSGSAYAPSLGGEVWRGGWRRASRLAVDGGRGVGGPWTWQAASDARSCRRRREAWGRRAWGARDAQIII